MILIAGPNFTLLAVLAVRVVSIGDLTGQSHSTKA